MKTFEEFLKDLETDDELKAKLKDALEATEVKTEETKISLLTKLAAENGYKVSTEDFAKHQASCQELDEDELNLVSGGGWFLDDGGYCFMDFACESAWNTCAVSNECPGTHGCSKSVYYK